VSHSVWTGGSPTEPRKEVGKLIRGNEKRQHCPILN
jgi:hypothetical protein